MKKSYTEGPLQTLRLVFFNLFHEILVILKNIKNFHPAAGARGTGEATERAVQDADGRAENDTNTYTHTHTHTHTHTRSVWPWRMLTLTRAFYANFQNQAF